MPTPAQPPANHYTHVVTQPQASHGMLVYSRWDYIDRENGLGSKFWTCYPDGRDPRALHGNYPHPYSVQPEYDGPKKGSRPLGPCSEMHFRAIPNSPLYIFTGVPHHGAAFGPLALLDPRLRDQGTMNQVTRITADQRFPESQTREGIETDDRILKYGTPWPLSGAGPDGDCSAGSRRSPTFLGVGSTRNSVYRLVWSR